MKAMFFSGGELSLQIPNLCEKYKTVDVFTTDKRLAISEIIANKKPVKMKF
jgi:hypothetical protein